jgi:putative holliday junction resolvase
MNVLVLDCGTARTGVVYINGDINVPVPIGTITHTDEQELLSELLDLAQKREVHTVVIGLPLLPDGSVGSQALYVQNIGILCENNGFQVKFIDERYTTPRVSNHPDTDSACQIAQTFLAQSN